MLLHCSNGRYYPARTWVAIAFLASASFDAIPADNDSRGEKRKVSKTVPSDIAMPAITNEAQLNATVVSAHARLNRAPQDALALDSLAWAGVTLAGWALEAEAIGDTKNYRRHLERMSADLQGSGERMEYLAKRGWPGAWAAVGLLRERGLLLDQFQQDACDAYAKAVTSSPAAAWHTGQCLQRDDENKAWQLIELAAGSGHAGALEWMGRRCLGDFGGTRKDPKCAREWLIMAASSGRPTAQTLLAFLFITGSGGPSDVPRGIKLYHLAAEKGDASAQNNLGESYETGRGVATNIAVALEWYERAAKSGLPAAQFNAGRLLAVGIEGKRDLDTARALLVSAQANGIVAADPVIRWIDEQLAEAAKAAPR